MFKVVLPATLSDLLYEEKDDDGNPKRNEFLQALSLPEVKSSLLVLILNEIRLGKTMLQAGKEFDSRSLLAKLVAWTDLLDLQAFIENKQGPAPDLFQDDIEE